MTAPSLLPPTRTQLLEALTAAETNLAIARREADTAWDNYDDACELRALDMASNEDLVLAESKAKDFDQLYFKAYQQVDEIKARLLELDNRRTEAARNCHLYPLTADEQAALNAAKAEYAARTQVRLDNVAENVSRRWGHLDGFSENLAAMDLASAVMVQQVTKYLNNQEWCNLMNAQDEPAFVTQTDRPLYFVNGGTDEAGGVGDGQLLENIF